MPKGQIYCLIITILAATTFCQNITVSWNCQACSNMLVGKNCYVLNGGPFLSFEVSIDQQAASCSATNQTYPKVYSFFCSNSSSCSESCYIRISTYFSYTEYCPVYEDTDQKVKKLNDMYLLASGNEKYQWCLNAGCPNKQGPSTGLILGIVFGVIVLIGVIVGVIFLVRKKKKMQSPLLNDQN